MKTVLFILTQVFWLSGFCQTGTITGEVTSRIHGRYEVLQFALVRLENTNFHANSAYGGRYVLDSIPAGDYEISASYVQRETIYKRVKVVSDSVIDMNFEFTCQYDRHEKDSIFPVCFRSDRVVRVKYGMMIVPYGNKADTTCFWGGTDQIPLCHPYWYCKRDKLEF
ncbi:MAG: carboxypeptidase-like regulatory domain-containing protein [Bacteroidota bacterium]